MAFDWIPPKNYKRHYICLHCQKGFKRPSKKDMKHVAPTDLSSLMKDYYASETKQDILEYIKATYQKMSVICPNCSKQMIQVHYNFEVPPQRDHKSWKMLHRDMGNKIQIKYDTYISWHRLELRNSDKKSAKRQKLEQNLARLIAAND